MENQLAQDMKHEIHQLYVGASLETSRNHFKWVQRPYIVLMSSYKPYTILMQGHPPGNCQDVNLGKGLLGDINLHYKSGLHEPKP